MGFLRNYWKPQPQQGVNSAQGVADTVDAAEKPQDDGKETDKSSQSQTLREGRLSSSIMSQRSRFPEGDFRLRQKEDIDELRSDIMLAHLHDQQRGKRWIQEECPAGEGVILRVRKGKHICCPETLLDDESHLFEAMSVLNVKCAMTINTHSIKTYLSLTHDCSHVPLQGSSEMQIQLIPSQEHLYTVKKYHFGAFIQDQKILVVWDQDPKDLIRRADQIEELLIQKIWNCKSLDPEQQPFRSSVVAVPRVNEDENEDKEAQAEPPRPTVMYNPVSVAVTIILLVASLGLGWREVAMECTVDHKFHRLGLIAVVVPQLFLSLFFMQVVVINGCQIIGPVGHLKSNSKFYSAIPCKRLSARRCQLPHVTIQMPVYKEGLHFVIKPTIKSVLAAISTYELQGGTASIFINDDGMQLISQLDQEARQLFYEENNIGWVARPEHDPQGEKGVPFTRKGKFKKASNMNYGLMISNKVEEKLLAVQRHEKWNQDREDEAYKKALEQTLEEHEGRARAGGNIRIGDYILLIDSDTRVPDDCLLDAVSEMEAYSQIGIMQFTSGVMQVSDSFFEKGVTFFTNLIYTAIRFAVANGDVSPFVGHNAILRWSAIQQVSFEDEDGYEKFWSESHVSEDFDMSLRLQVQGYIIRLASYTGEGFKEGVSLTVSDELARWEKYAYGCNELLFHPLFQWYKRGPFTPLFRKFICSNMRLTSKITIMAYIGTYYAIGAAWILTLANYFLIGFFNGYVSHYYLDSFKIYFALILIFSGLGNVALAIVRYRLAEANLFHALVENFKWLLLMTIFLGGISIHVSQALVSHFLGIDMSWGATAKEIDQDVIFHKEVRVVGKSFKWTFMFCFAATAVILVGRFALPLEWRVMDFVAIFPLVSVIVSHFCLPLVLNPGVMLFSF